MQHLEKNPRWQRYLRMGHIFKNLIFSKMSKELFSLNPKWRREPRCRISVDLKQENFKMAAKNQDGVKCIFFH
jgi:hypothetical protein